MSRRTNSLVNAYTVAQNPPETVTTSTTPRRKTTIRVTDRVVKLTQIGEPTRPEVRVIQTTQTFD